MPVFHACDSSECLCAPPCGSLSLAIALSVNVVQPLPAELFQALEDRADAIEGARTSANTKVISQRVPAAYVKGATHDWYLLTSSAPHPDLSKALGSPKTSSNSYYLFADDRGQRRQEAASLTGAGRLRGGIPNGDLFQTFPTAHRLLAEWVRDDATHTSSGSFVGMSERFLDLGSAPFPAKGRDTSNDVDTDKGVTQPWDNRWYQLVSLSDFGANIAYMVMLFYSTTQPRNMSLKCCNSVSLFARDFRS